MGCRTQLGRAAIDTKLTPGIGGEWKARSQVDGGLVSVWCLFRERTREHGRD